MPTGTRVITPDEPQTTDYQLIKRKVPDWLTTAQPATRDTLRAAPLAQLDWLATLTADQRQQLKHYNERGVRSQQVVDQAMAGVQEVGAFAKPLLVKALKEKWNLDADPDQVFIHLRKPFALGSLGLRVGDFSVLTLSLLQAALHNFEAPECLPQAFDDSSRFRLGPTPQDAQLESSMTVPGFLTLCRTLDIGAQYQDHLNDFFYPADTRLREQVCTAQQDALQAAAYLALLKHDIDDADYALMLAVIGGEGDLTLGGKPVWFCDLSLMGLRLSGCTVFVAVDKYRYASDVLVYLPHDPEHPLKKYPTTQALEAELTQRLMADAGSAPSRYQRYLGNFLAYAEQPTYFSRLTQPSSGGPGDPFALLRSPITQFLLPIVAPVLSLFLNPRELPPRQTGAREPVESANFYIRVVSKGGLWAPNVALWQDNFEKLRTKLLADARSHAVPTADVDAQARARKIAALEQGGLFALNLVSMFLPVLGEVMMGVMAGQLLHETFEGVIEWGEGDRQAALEHVTDVAQNLAMLAVMAGGGIAVRRLRAPPAVIETLKPVTLTNGEQKLWKPDLSPYTTTLQPEPGTAPDALGLYPVNGQKLLRLDADHYVVNRDADSGEFRIGHPTREQAYAPRLEHNHDGAWQHENEHPSTWDTPTVLRRLGLPDPLPTAEDLQQGMTASGLESDALRAMHIDHEPVPLMLVESLKRLRIHRQLTRFVEQIKSPEPARYAQADLALQMDILKRRGLLPDTPPLRVYDNRGMTLWDDPAPVSVAREGVVINDLHATRGEQMHTLLTKLHALDPQLTEIPGRPEDPLTVRAHLLRQFIGEQVESFQDALAEERYQAQDAIAQPEITRLQGHYRQLPTAMARHLLQMARADELSTFHRTGRLPPRLDEQARWLSQETRVSRAYEGLFLDRPGLDAQRLALHSLETLPGWRSGTRLELRLGSDEGELLDAIGSPNQPPRVLVLEANGEFHGATAGDFYSATWDLLAPHEQQTLNLSSPAQLKAHIVSAPVAREAMRTVLLERPLRKPAYDASMRLLGGGRGLPRWVTDTANLFRSPQTRVRRLYPSFDEAQATAFVQSLGEDISGGLERLESEYATLKADLRSWVNANTPREAVTGYERRGGDASVLANQIKRCWRGETVGELKWVPVRAMSLPALKADFSHVEDLALFDTSWNRDADQFLRCFKQLRRLRIGAKALLELPEAVGDMHNLRSLSLRNSRVRLTSQSVERLAGCSQLVKLDLSGNALGMAPDFSAMPHLKFIDLSNAELEQWPTGLRDQADLQQVELSGNLLRSIPEEVLVPATAHAEQIIRINSVTRIVGNPLSEQALAELDAYWQRLEHAHPQVFALGGGDAFSIETPMIGNVRRMFPRFGTGQARQYIWNLGEGAELQVGQQREEFELLNDQLQAWVFSGGGARQRYVRMGQVRENAADLDHRNLAKARILSCWRKETPQKLAADGTPFGVELDLSNLHLPSLPDLDADFSHVGSLKLSNMNLRASPEGFLARHRGARWLDLSHNQLRELPPALGDMHGLTRLFLQGNQIRLTPQTATVLAQRTTLRALWLDSNPLGLTPDLSQIPDMRSLRLNRTGIDTWPSGLGHQPLLDEVDLSENRLTTLPDAVINPPQEQLARSAHLNNITNVADNPFSAAVLERVQAYAVRLAENGLTQPGSPNRLVVTAVGIVSRAVRSLEADTAFQRWITDLPTAEQSLRQTQWLVLREQPGGDGFFSMLTDLEAADNVRADMQQRVWRVIDSITEHTAESETLREQMFEWAGRAACTDRAALSFSNVEIMSMVYRARAVATDQSQGVALMTLSRGLFRLDEVEKTALSDIAARTAEINARPGLSVAARRALIGALEEVEIRLAYRMGLKGDDRLGLPGQPEHVRFTQMANVSQQTLDATYSRIIALDDSPEEFQALLSREFWKDYVTQKYRAQFEAQSKPYHEQLAGLLDRVEAGQLANAEYEARARLLQDQLGIAEASLIESLSRTECANNPLGAQGQPG